MRSPRGGSWLGVRHVEEPQPSERTLLLLRRNALADLWPGDVSELLVQLSELIRREPTPDKIYSLAEIAYLGAKHCEESDPQRGLELYAAAVTHAYLYLFDDRFHRVANPYDPEFRGACDLYNRALEHCLRITQSKGIAPGMNQTLHTANQTIEVAMVSRGKSWRPEDFERFEFVTDYEVTGLQNHYHTFGLGVPLIGVRKKQSVALPIERYYPEGLSFAVTAFLRIVPHQDGKPNHHVALLELYDPLNASGIEFEGRRVPLETDLSTPLAYALNQPKLRNLDTSYSGFLHPDATEKAQGLYMLEPYQPGKIPVIMVHGVWSSPITWMEMFNDLRSSPEIRNRFQFWFYLYPTGQPFWYSAAQLRADLARVRQVADPKHAEPAFDQIVLVGHSMGGLVSELQGVESGDAYWRAISKEPFDRLRASDEIKQTLADTYFFHPNPSVRRMIFISTPHRGTDYANNVAAWLGNKLITLPKLLVAGGQQLHRDNPSYFHSPNLIDIYTSIDALSPSCPIFPALAESPRAKDLHVHSIIGVLAEKGKAPPPDGGGDGVVPYASAHLEGADSEITVNADHSLVQRHPLSVLEVRRILLEHLATLPPRAGEPVWPLPPVERAAEARSSEPVFPLNSPATPPDWRPPPLPSESPDPALGDGPHASHSVGPGTLPLDTVGQDYINAPADLGRRPVAATPTPTASAAETASRAALPPR